MILFLLRLLLITGLGFGVYWWFSFVLPPVAAMIVGALVAVVAGATAIAGQMKLGMLAAGGPVFLAWPAGAVIAAQVAEAMGYTLTWVESLSLSWWLALIAYKINFALAKNKDSARDLGAILLGAILIYIVAAVLLTRSTFAVIGLALGVAATAAVVRQHLLIAPVYERYLINLAGVGCIAAFVAGIRHAIVT
jgi:hypothetical protein